MAEIKKTKTRMYDPWGYQEENNYDSSENQFEIELNALFASAAYNDNDKKIHFFNNDGLELSGSSIDTTQFASGVIESASYDKETKILTIVFSNGDIVEINLADLIDETEFADGLQVNDGIVSIKLDSATEAYLTVSESGLKLSGVDAAINVEKTRAEEAETALDAKINAEETRAKAEEAALDAKINAEETRAKVEEAALDTKIDEEIARATSAETALDTKIDAEKTRAEEAEATLDAKIETEKTRATQTEQHLNERINLVNDELDAEESIREAADVALGRRIDNEVNRATTAEATLNGRVDDLIEDLQPLLNDTLVTTNDKEAALGKYNVSNTSEDASGRTIFSIGNGTADDARSNALEVRENGDVYMWVEGDYMQINRLLAMLAHEVYDTNANNNHNMNYDD